MLLKSIRLGPPRTGFLLPFRLELFNPRIADGEGYLLAARRQRMYERQRFQLNWPLSLICNRPTSLMGNPENRVLTPDNQPHRVGRALETCYGEEHPKLLIRTHEPSILVGVKLKHPVISKAHKFIRNDGILLPLIALAYRLVGRRRGPKLMTPRFSILFRSQG